MRILLSLFALLFFTLSQAQGLTINEVMALNESTITDEDGDYSDWIELYNTSASALELSGWFLSDDASDPYKWQIATASIAANGYLLVFASDKNRQGPGELHANFKISAAGESIYLTDPAGVLIDFIPATELSADVSLGAAADGISSPREFFNPSSPNASNATGQAVNQSSAPIVFSAVGGFYDSGFGLELTAPAGAEIRYTLDGSAPQADSPLYTTAIMLHDRLNEDDQISLIETGLNWESPRSKGEKATVVKAASFINGQANSPVQTQSYFISSRLNERYSGLPVISLSVHADSLFSAARGIYIAGDNYADHTPRGTGNYYMKGRDWEREVHMEFFNEEHQKAFAQQVGARVHGNTSRHHPQKTLRLYARSDYGQSHFNYPFFEGKDLLQFKRILLRNSSTDFGETMFKDILCTELITDMEMDYMASQVCIVYINGEYWGVHSIRERIDQHFLANNHGLDPDDIDLLTLNAVVEEGDAQAYHEVYDYISTHNLSDAEAYDYVSQRLDIYNVMDYNIAQMYFANFDWPNVNIRYWQGQDPAQKWRWIFYDCDRCMILPDYDHLIDVVQPENQNNNSPDWTILIFNRLLQNESFKEDFVQRFFFHLSTTFEGSRVLGMLDELEDLYEPLVVEHIERWGYPSSVNVYHESLQELRAFIIKRPAVMVQQLVDYLGEQYVLYPNPVQSDRQYVNLDIAYTEGVHTQIEIYTPVGELVQRLELSTLEGEEHPRIPIDGLSSGLYIVKLSYGALVFTEKLMVE